MNTYFKCLTIAGSDSGGGAGIQADIKTISAIGIFATSAITAITAQNTLGVTGIQPIASHIVKKQIEAVLDDIGTDSIKIGMLYSGEIARTVWETLSRYKIRHIVLDPVMISTSGHKLVEDEAIEIIKSVLMKDASLLTPNLDEASLLSEIDINNISDLYRAGEILLKKGCRNVLMKSGHLKGTVVTDILFSVDQPPIELSAHKVETSNTHGTGCTLSSAIASYLALGKAMPEAVTCAKDFINQAIISGADVKIGAGHGPLNHFYAPNKLKKYIT